MKTLVLLPVGLITILALAGCGSSGNNNGGNEDASTPADTGSGGGQDSGGGGTDATIPGDDTGTGNDTGTGADAPAAVCGDGVVEGSEECDDGTKNGTAGDPCTSSCQWVCIQGSPTRGDTACASSGNSCAGTATCLANHTCQAGTPAADGTLCGAGTGLQERNVHRRLLRRRATRAGGWEGL
jgi:cysteine-rich repeat protein